MILGLGTDIIAIERIKTAIERQGEALQQRLFTERERVYCNSFKAAERHYAGRFAAKEAVVKAAGCGISEGVSWHDVEILNDAKGAPTVILSGVLKELLGDVSIFLTISHCESYATATALITRCQ